MWHCGSQRSPTLARPHTQLSGREPRRSLPGDAKLNGAQLGRVFVRADASGKKRRKNRGVDNDGENQNAVRSNYNAIGQGSDGVLFLGELAALAG
jgi:hypothetical protein